jgi:hypothetical protein
VAEVVDAEGVEGRHVALAIEPALDALKAIAPIRTDPDAGEGGRHAVSVATTALAEAALATGAATVNISLVEVALAVLAMGRALAPDAGLVIPAFAASRPAVVGIGRGAAAAAVTTVQALTAPTDLLPTRLAPRLAGGTGRISTQEGRQGAEEGAAKGTPGGSGSKVQGQAIKGCGIHGNLGAGRRRGDNGTEGMREGVLVAP